MSLISVVAEFERWFIENGLKPPVVIRLADKETGMHFAQIAEKEVATYGPKAQFMKWRHKHKRPAQYKWCILWIHKWEMRCVGHTTWKGDNFSIRSWERECTRCGLVQQSNEIVRPRIPGVIL